MLRGPLSLGGRAAGRSAPPPTEVVSAQLLYRSMFLRSAVTAAI